MRKFDSSRHFANPEAIAAYLNEILAMNDTELFIEALGDVAKAQGMTEIARRVGVGRESLYKSLSAAGNPRFDTIRKILAALGVELSAQPASATSTAADKRPVYT